MLSKSSRRKSKRSYHLFGQTFTVSMGAIMYSGIYFATDLISEKYGRREANTAVILGAISNIVIMFTLV